MMVGDRRRRALRRRASGAAVVAAGLLAACTSSNQAKTPESVPPPATTEVTSVDDGVLEIGVLLPSSGEGAPIGLSARDAVRIAVSLANNSVGGVNGVPVKLVVRDEGADIATAAVALQQLIDTQVDVIIGPASSNVATALLPAIVQAGIASCSPSATALGLDQFPDNGLFFRTVPSDSLEAEAMATVIEQTGETTAAIAYVDDGYGAPFETELENALRRRGIAVVDTVGFAVDDNEFESEAIRLLGAGDGAIALIGDPDAGSRMIDAIATTLKSQRPRDIVINDALRRPWSLGLLGAVSSGLRARIVGVSPLVKTTSDEMLTLVQHGDTSVTGLFATQAFDCANLLMLGAQQSRSTDGRAIAELVPGISVGGSQCQSFESCVSLLSDGRNIDYDSPGGILALGVNGDPSAGLFDVFNFDETGRDVSVRMVTVSAPG